MYHLDLTAEELTLIRRALVKTSGQAYREASAHGKIASLEAAQAWDDLLDRLPDPTDPPTVILGAAPSFPDPHEAAALLDEYHAERISR